MTDNPSGDPRIRRLDGPDTVRIVPERPVHAGHLLATPPTAEDEERAAAARNLIALLGEKGHDNDTRR